MSHQPTKTLCIALFWLLQTHGIFAVTLAERAEQLRLDFTRITRQRTKITMQRLNN